MQSLLRKIHRHLGYVLGLCVMLAVTSPALEAHACIPEPVSAFTALDNSVDEAPACPDCGPACASGCCHLAHAAIPAEAPPATAALPVAAPSAWVSAASAPLILPSGPDRPPRS